MDACIGEAVILELVNGELDGDDAAAAHIHIDRCEDCRQGLAAATRSYFATGGRASEVAHERAESFDRYLIIDVVGAGATGIVYAAFDTKLDRKIALKLVRRTPGIDDSEPGEWSERFLREAQVLARLSHPNVVAVHDVGSLDGQIFIAMEFVDGTSVAHWLATRPTWQETLRSFEQAARGLAAAHAAGIVHRDFKPENLLRGSDGRVRVADFGLATPVADHASVYANGTPSIVVGTPAYVAPEQIGGAAPDAKADQFSFCVALYEALYRQLPFAGETLAARNAEIEAGRIRLPPKDVRVPMWLRARLLRGLAANPEQRYSSIDALLDALVDDRARHRRRIAIAAMIGAAAIAGAVGYRLLGASERPSCRSADRELAGVWNPDRRQAIARAFAATGKPFAADVERSVLATFDNYGARWTAMHTETCEATRVRGEQSEELLDLRMSCLSTRLQELRALVDVMARADAATLERAPRAAETLTNLASCANVAALRAKLPADVAIRVHLDQLQHQLADARALEAAGRGHDAMPIATAVVVEAKRQAYRPFEADASNLLGLLQTDGGDAKAAESSFLDAVVAAEAGRHDEALAQAMGALTFTVGYDQGRYAEGESWARQAVAVIERLGGSDALSGRIHNNLGSMRYRQGRYDDAIREDGVAIADFERAFGPDGLELANALNNLGAPLEAAGRFGDALVQFRRALEIYERKLGPKHPDVAMALNNIGAALRDLGKLDEASAQFERALQIKEALLGRDHVTVAASLENLANVRKDQGRYDDALALLDRALAIRIATQGADHVEVGVVHQDRGDVLALAGKLDPALAEYRLALEIKLKKLGRDHPKVIELVLNRAEAEANGARYAAALADYTSAAGTIEGNAALARYAPFALTGIGDCELGLHEPAKAVPPLERALAMRLARPDDPLELARTRFAIARAVGHASPRAVELARAAHDTYAAAGKAGEAREHEVAQWLARPK